MLLCFLLSCSTGCDVCNECRSWCSGEGWAFIIDMSVLLNGFCLWKEAIYLSSSNTRCKAHAHADKSHVNPEFKSLDDSTCVRKYISCSQIQKKHVYICKHTNTDSLSIILYVKVLCHWISKKDSCTSRHCHTHRCVHTHSQHTFTLPLPRQCTHMVKFQPYHKVPKEE